MAISSNELRKKTFSVVPKGYDRPEVNRYLADLADQLEQFNAQHSSGPQADEASQARATEPETTAVETAQIDDDRSAEPTMSAPTNANADDDFDRVGAEISVMLRQAHESASKIREDAEVEARSLIDQVRLDIEADRVAHESAAAELISRTEERATAIRTSAEDYGRETRSMADHYAETRHNDVEAELAASISEAEATRQLTAEHLTAANREASAMVEEATHRSRTIIAEAEAFSGKIQRDGQAKLQAMLEAEARTREDLLTLQRSISTILDHDTIADLDASRHHSYRAEGQAS